MRIEIELAFNETLFFIKSDRALTSSPQSIPTSSFCEPHRILNIQLSAKIVANFLKVSQPYFIRSVNSSIKRPIFSAKYKIALNFSLNIFAPFSV